MSILFKLMINNLSISTSKANIEYLPRQSILLPHCGLFPSLYIHMYINSPISLIGGKIPRNSREMCTNHHIIEHIYCYSITLALHEKTSIVKYIIIVLFLNCFSNRCLYNLFYMVLRRVNFKSYCSLEHYSYICPTSARIHKYEFYFLCLILFSYLQNCT